MTEIAAFVARLNRAAATLETLTDPILTEYGNVVRREISKNAPKRTRRQPGSTLDQVSPGVLELRSGYLVGEVRGTAQSSPKSRTFLSDSLSDISKPLARATARAAVSALTDRHFRIG